MNDLANEGNSVVEKTSCSFSGCVDDVLNKCRNCGLDYCLEHASTVDPARYCVTCLSTPDAHFDVAPLKDETGTTHHGRIIHPTGRGYRLAEKMVNEMTDDELKTFVNEEKIRVADIERVREYHHITLGLAESELYQRHISVFTERGGVLHIGTSVKPMPRQKRRAEDLGYKPAAKAKASKVDKIATMLGELKISPADLAKLLGSVKGKK